jgi:hypothetical protein
MAVDPDDVREFFLDDLPRSAADLGHLVLADLEPAVDHVLGHLPAHPLRRFECRPGSPMAQRKVT